MSRSFEVSASYIPTTHDRVGVQESLDDCVRLLRAAGAQDVRLSHDPGSWTFNLSYSWDCADAHEALVRQVGMTILEFICQFPGMQVELGPFITHPPVADVRGLADMSSPDIDPAAAPEYIDL